MAIKIKLKNSVVANKAPLPTDLDIGEVAINANAASPAAYIKDSAGAVVKLAGVGSVSTPDATTAAKGVVQLADAAAVTAGTAGRVVDAAQLKAVSDADDWTRTGTEIHPKVAGDSVFTTGAVKVGGTTAAPNLQLKADGGIVANTNGLVYDAATKHLGVGTAAPGSTLTVKGATGVAPLQISGPSSELARIDSSGRLLVGTSSGSDNDALLKVQGNVGASTGAGWIDVRRGQSSTINGQVGLVSFSDNSGNNCAWIEAYADATPGTNDYPGRLVFSTTADGASSPTERMRIRNNGIINFANTPVYADNTAAKTGGLVDGDVYRKSDGTLMIVYT